MQKEILQKTILIPQAKPILKWAGGKQQLWKEISRHFPAKYNKYIEPFLGGGAVFFGLKPEQAILADSNPELINLYEVVRDNVEGLICKLLDFKNNEEMYYEVRGLNVNNLDNVERAARMLYLNKTCFNGLYRVNKQGIFNVPFGHYKNPNICDADTLKLASKALQGKKIICGDYIDILNKYAEPGDLIFLDPPYLPISQNSDFKRYTKDFFYEKDHIRLANEFHRLYELGCTIILTNSNHPLVFELYNDYKLEVHKTKRFINSDASKRSGQDIIVVAQSHLEGYSDYKYENVNHQLDKFPGTRYMGSKNNLINEIWRIANQFKFNTVFDAFSGSGIVSYMFKTYGKVVYSNDFMTFASNITKAIVENNSIILDERDIEYLLLSDEYECFVTSTFQGLYFNDEENRFIDSVRSRIEKLENPYKKSLAMAALCRACLKKRPRGIFTYVGYKYDDGRKDLKKSLKEHFLESVHLYNNAVFSIDDINNVKNETLDEVALENVNETVCKKDNSCITFNTDTMSLDINADLVYFDPPYFSPLSDNEYTRRYHFVEGLSKNWAGLNIQWETKTKKFKKYNTPFGNREGAYDAFDKLFEKHQNSILMVSYSSNAFPTMSEMIELIGKYKRTVEVYKIDHTYSFGNQAHKVGNNRNKVQEYIFVAYN